MVFLRKNRFGRKESCFAPIKTPLKTSAKVCFREWNKHFASAQISVEKGHWLETPFSCPANDTNFYDPNSKVSSILVRSFFLNTEAGNRRCQWNAQKIIFSTKFVACLFFSQRLLQTFWPGVCFSCARNILIRKTVISAWKTNTVSTKVKRCILDSRKTFLK